MRWQGRRESDNVEDRRSSGGGGPSMGGPFPVTQRQGRHYSAGRRAGGGLLRCRPDRFDDR